MKTCIDIDERLIEKTLKLSNNKSRKTVIEQALENLIKSLMRKQMLELKGRVKWVGNID